MSNKLQKPHIIYHMLTSVDGKVTGDFLHTPESRELSNTYYQLHREYKADAFLCGRKTMQESFAGNESPNTSIYEMWKMGREDYIPYNTNNKFYAVAIDPHYKLNWQTQYITDSDPGYDKAYIIEVLCENTPDAFLAYLQAYNIAYIFAGKETINLPLAMHKLNNLFGINLLLLEGGDITGNSFIESGLIDEYSLVVSPSKQKDGHASLVIEELINKHHLTLIEEETIGEGKWVHLAKDEKKVVLLKNNTNVDCEPIYECDNSSLTIHDQIKHAIHRICIALGYKAEIEYRGRGWRADVYVEVGNAKYAFEVQTSPQSLRVTWERQNLYMQDGITCCWLFEKEKRNIREYNNLPLFQIFRAPNGCFSVSLKGRKKLPLDVFVYDFLNDRIRFCQHIKRSPKLDVKFLQMVCHECKAINYIYYIWPIKSACNAEIKFRDELWSSKKFLFHPEILKKVKEYVKSEKGKHLPMGEIKERYSATVGHPYMSFGCSKCDTLIGDNYIEDAILDIIYDEDNHVEHIEIEVTSADTMKEEFPHWCHPGELDFCE